MEDKLKLEKVESKGYGVIYKLPMLDKELDVVAKAFYAYLCSYAGAGDSAFPSMDKICYDLGVSRQRLERHRKALIKKGYITIKQVKDKGRFSHNEYTINKTLSPMLQNATTEKPTTEKPTTEKPTSENVTYNNNSINNNSINNNSSSNNNNVPVKTDTIPYQEIIEYLNLKTGKKFKHKTAAHRKFIKARWEEGNTFEEFKIVIDKMVCEWTGTEFQNYLQPSTLFGNKFENYLNKTSFKFKQNNNKSQKQDAMSMMLEQLNLGGYENEQVNEPRRDQLLIP